VPSPWLGKAGLSNFKQGQASPASSELRLTMTRLARLELKPPPRLDHTNGHLPRPSDQQKRKRKKKFKKKKSIFKMKDKKLKTSR